MTCESTAYVARPLCAKQHGRYFSRLPAQSKRDWKVYFPQPLAPLSKSTQLESLNQEAWPDIFFKSYVLLDNNHFFNTAEKFKGT